MAKTVSDVFLRLKVEGQQTLERLKGSFRSLEKTVGVTDQGVEQLRQETIKYAEAGTKSIQVIKGQLDAFRGLRDQATVGSRAYIRLTSDISRLTSELKKLDASLKDTERQATRTFGQVLGGIPARAPGKFARDIGTLNTELNKYSVTSKRYGDILTEITQRTQAFTTAQARQAVIAAARPLQTQAVGAIRLDEKLPNTTAALRLQIAELTQQLDNADRKSTDYYIIQNRLNVLQKELTGNVEQQAAAYDRLAAAQDASIRRAKKIADIQEYYRTQGPLAPGAGGYRDPVTGAMIARGTRAGIVPLSRSSISENIFPASGAAQMMAARKGSSRQALGARGYAQGAGAVLSGGIFGGPEGFLGGLGGLALGGPSGAFAGAAAGAQVSMLRKSVGSTAEYAAEIGKLQIALRGVAGSQAAFNQAMRAAADTTKDLNVPQETAIGGMTRLTAAIRGAGGTVSDAEVVFKNVTSAIKATGGGAQDVQGAITAMVQVFSKGKVSAEELSGQLGERLPGAVTMFAEANKMTLPELQKALKDGTVGLNELMNFIVELGNKYDKTAKKIAGSSQDAGARLTVAFNQMRLEVGKSLQPIGAEFQDAFGVFITQITPQFIEAAKAAGGAVVALAKNLDKVVIVANFAAALAGVTLALKLLTAMRGPVNTFFLLLQAHFGKTTAQAIVAQTKLKAFALTVKTLAASLAAPIIITVALVGAQIVLSWLDRIKKAKQDLVDQEKKPVGEDFLKSIGGDAATKDTIKRNLSEINKAYDTYTQTIQKRGERINKMVSEQRLLAQSGPVGALAAQGMQTKIDVLQAEQDVDVRKYVDLQKSREALQKRLASAPEGGLTQFAALGGEEKAGSGKRLMLQAELDLRNRVRAAQLDQNKLAEIDAQFALDQYTAKLETKDLVKQQDMLEEASYRRQMAIRELFTDLVSSREKYVDQERSINASLKERQYNLGLISKEEYTQFQIAEERARLTKAYPGEGFAGRRAQLEDLYRREVDPTFQEAGETEVKRMKDELEEMTKPLNQLKGAAMAFGESISQAFSNIVTGSQTAQQAMAQFLKNLGQYFVEYAAKVITQMIAIATIQAVIKALGGPSTSGGGAGASSTPDISGFSSYDISNTPTLSSFGNAQGNAFSKGLKRYAMGGVVNKPTMFTYAEGGTGRFGLMGEAGPEAIIPLKRGNDGRLGVSAYFADANAAMAKGAANRSSSAAFDENAEALALGNSYSRERVMERERQTMLTGAGGSMLIQTQVINNVEYATMDQVAQATAASAKQARAQVFADMRNKPSTRSSLGMR